MSYPKGLSDGDLNLAAEAIVHGAGPYSHERGVGKAVRDYHLTARRWFRVPGVLGIGIGLRNVCGHFTQDIGLTIYVDRKYPRRVLEYPIPSRLLVPGVETEIPVDVLDVGTLRFQQGGTEVGGGSKIRHERDVNYGTLGCLVREPEKHNKLYILSNSHVLALKGAAAPTENICAVRQDNSSGPPIAKLTKWIHYFEAPFPNLVDAAIAEVVSPEVSPDIGNIGPTGLGKLCFPGMRVHILGGASGQTGSTIVQVGAELTFDIPTISGGQRRVCFRDQVVCVNYTQPGDSGSCVLNDRGRAIGIHFLATDWNVDGKTQRVSIFNPMENVLSEFKKAGFNLEIVTVEGSPDLSSSPMSESVTPSTPVAPMAPAFGRLPPTGHPEDAVDVMARTIWGEARGEGVAGMKAVSEVIYNRTMKQLQRFGLTVEAVCRKPFQFSCWNTNDPNLAKLQRVDGTDAQFQICLQVAKQVVNGDVTTLTNGADHYYDARIPIPNWAADHRPCAQISHHLFFNDIP